ACYLRLHSADDPAEFVSSAAAVIGVTLASRELEKPLIIPRSGRRGICFLDDLIFGIWPARRLSFGTQLLQRLLRFCRSPPLRQDFQIFLLVSSRLFR